MEDSFIIWLAPKKITSKKNGQEYELYTGKLTLEGKTYDLSGFLTPEKDGKKPYLKGKVKPEYTGSGGSNEF